jgi:Protein of unknown function (DUF3261)
VRGVAVAVLVAALAACAAQRARAPRALAPIVATEEIPGDFVLVQHLRVTRADQVQEFDAVVQNACGELLVLPLSPFGKPAFVIRQRGLSVAVDAAVPAAPLPFEPERVLLDIERTYFVPLGAPPPADGRREVAWRGETIDEAWADARLRERVYRGDTGAGRLRVAYPDGMTAGELPARASLTNESLGYAIDVTTVSRTEVDCPP